jgi:hypothetical protein
LIVKNKAPMSGIDETTLQGTDAKRSKLKLERQVIRTLSGAELALVGGGATIQGCGVTNPNCGASRTKSG